MRNQSEILNPQSAIKKIRNHQSEIRNSQIIVVPCKKQIIMEDNFYQFTARSLQGKEISMDSYKGKIILVVNTASKCGLTPQ